MYLLWTSFLSLLKNINLGTNAAQMGIAAQGNGVNNPVSFFNDHALVRIAINDSNGTTTYKYYDPSYGTGPFNSLGDWEANSIAAFGAYITFNSPQTNLLLWIEKLNTPATNSVDLLEKTENY